MTVFLWRIDIIDNNRYSCTGYVSIVGVLLKFVSQLVFLYFSKIVEQRPANSSPNSIYHTLIPDILHISPFQANILGDLSHRETSPSLHPFPCHPPIPIPPIPHLSSPLPSPHPSFNSQTCLQHLMQEKTLVIVLH